MIEFALPHLHGIVRRRRLRPAAGHWMIGLTPGDRPWQTLLSPQKADQVAADLARRPPGAAVVIVALVDLTALPPLS